MLTRRISRAAMVGLVVCLLAVWQLVNAADGQIGYGPNDFLRLAADTPAPVAPEAAPPKTAPAESKEPAKDLAPTPSPPLTAPSEPAKAAPPAAPIEPIKPAAAKSESILQMLEGHETEAKLGLIIAAIFFALGWLCGGGYYARRERKSRHKLRF